MNPKIVEGQTTQWSKELEALSKLNTEPFMGASHNISIHLANRFQRRRFLEINQSETRITCDRQVS